jgi:hypothetical protein
MFSKAASLRNLSPRTIDATQISLTRVQKLTQSTKVARTLPCSPRIHGFTYILRERHMECAYYLDLCRLCRIGSLVHRAPAKAALREAFQAPGLGYPSRSIAPHRPVDRSVYSGLLSWRISFRRWPRFCILTSSKRRSYSVQRTIDPTVPLRSSWDRLLFVLWGESDLLTDNRGRVS